MASVCIAHGLALARPAARVRAQGALGRWNRVSTRRIVLLRRYRAATAGMRNDPRRCSHITKTRRRVAGGAWRFLSVSAGRRRPDEDLAKKMPRTTRRGVAWRGVQTHRAQGALPQKKPPAWMPAAFHGITRFGQPFFLSHSSIAGRRCVRTRLRYWMLVIAVSASRREVGAMFLSAKALIRSIVESSDEPPASIG